MICENNNEDMYPFFDNLCVRLVFSGHAQSSFVKNDNNIMEGLTLLYME